LDSLTFIRKLRSFYSLAGYYDGLLKFYKCYRACVRGKVACFMLDDPHVSEEEKTGALNAARMYFELAESYV